MNMDPNQTETFRSKEEELLDVLLSPSGYVRKMLTPIRKVSFYSDAVASAFRLYEKNLPIGGTFTLTEILTATELLANRRELIGKVGEGIYLLTSPITDRRLRETLLTRSVPGLCALLQACGGAELTLSSDVALEQLLSARLFLLPVKDGDRIAASGAISAERVGTVCADELRLIGTDGTAASRSLQDVFSASPIELSIPASAEELYTDGFRSVLAYHCACIQSGTYFVNLASDWTLPEMLACALGMFEAMLHHRMRQPVMRFLPNGRSGLIVPRPYVTEGDAVYAFRPKCDPQGRPLPTEVIKLRRYLENGAKNGMIKSVLPLKKNAREMLLRLGNYVEEQPFPQDCFAVLAIVSGEQEIPGTRIGSFQEM